MAIIEAVVGRGRARRGPVPVVPTAVRVEACWDRRAAGAAVINRLQFDDVPLDASAADRAARVLNALHVSVADAHLGATAMTLEPCVVVTSDVDDVRRVAASFDVAARVVLL